MSHSLAGAIFSSDEMWVVWLGLSLGLLTSCFVPLKYMYLLVIGSIFVSGLESSFRFRFFCEGDREPGSRDAREMVMPTSQGGRCH